MKLSEILAPELVVVPLEAADKWQAIARLARVAVDAGALPTAQWESVHAALVARERSMTTGMEHGVAIPHAAVDRIDTLVAVLGLSPHGIPFGALDGQPARIVVGLVIPRAQKLAHIKTLAEIAKLLAREGVRNRLLASADAGAALRVIAAEGG